jgi:uncharacterized protein YciI
MRNVLVVTLLTAAAALAQSAPAAPAPANKQFLWRMEAVRPGLALDNLTPEERKAAMGHWAYLKTLEAQGKLSHAVQVFDPKGFWGFTIVNAPTLEEARAIVNGDPFVPAGVFRGDVLPIRIAIDATPAQPSAPAK